MIVLGEISVDIKLQELPNSCIGKLVIVGGTGPCLLGRDLISKLNLNNVRLSEINKISDNSDLLKKFPILFSEGVGCFKDRLFTIEVDPSVPPKYCNPRTVPYALRDKVDKELDRLKEQGIITPITNSRWASPVVPVLKSDNEVRICGDYKLTANKAASLDTYPIPKHEDLFSKLSGGAIFSKLDMAQAYSQLCLDEESKQYTVINTPKSLFKYNRLCFGISSAPGIFQRAMEELLRGMPGVSCYFVDILITASSKEEHDSRLHDVLTRLQDAGLRLRLDKCHIGMPKVTYLGYQIDKEGIHPTKYKVSAIVKAPKPTNLTQLRAYLGVFNFYRRFVHNASTILEPLNRLLRDKVTWTWGKEEDGAFEASKDALLSSDVLVHFDPSKPIVVVADSSAYGIGAVLCHLIDGNERPIYFASRSLTSAERNYSQLEKEALALVYALRQFHYYLWGQSNFKLVTDH